MDRRKTEIEIMIQFIQWGIKYNENQSSREVETKLAHLPTQGVTELRSEIKKWFLGSPKRHHSGLRRWRMRPQCGRPGFNPWVGKIRWRRTPLQCSCLENPVDRGAWWATVCGVIKSRTRLGGYAQRSAAWGSGRWERRDRSPGLTPRVYAPHTRSSCRAHCARGPWSHSRGCSEN